MHTRDLFSPSRDRKGATGAQQHGASKYVVPEKLSKSLFFNSKLIWIDGILCKEVLDDGPDHGHVGLGMETPAREVRAHPSGKRERPVSLRPDETPNRKGFCNVNTHPEDTRRLRFGLGWFRGFRETPAVSRDRRSFHPAVAETACSGTTNAPSP